MVADGGIEADAGFELLDRATGQSHAVVASETDAAVDLTGTGDGVAVDGVAVEVERDVVGADHEAVAGTVVEVAAQLVYA